MAHAINNKIKVQAFKKTKVETTYEYVPLLGKVLGYWRRISSVGIGSDIYIELVGDLDDYTKFIINGKVAKVTFED